MHRLYRLLLVALWVGLPAAGRAALAADPTLLFSYEVTSAVGLDLPKLGQASYA